LAAGTVTAMSEDVERESMEYDIVVVGAGPAGLAAAIRLKQLSADLAVAVLEKGSEVGAHILSGAVIDPKALNELIPDWKDKGAPLETAVTKDKYLWLGPAAEIDFSILGPLMPPLMRNHGNYVASLGNVCRWLASEAEGLGVEIYPGMAASDLVYREGRWPRCCKRSST
jgi:electron-transferring-flavoprotein dehydrogenase